MLIAAGDWDEDKVRNFEYSNIPQGENKAELLEFRFEYNLILYLEAVTSKQSSDERVGLSVTMRKFKNVRSRLKRFSGRTNNINNLIRRSVRGSSGISTLSWYRLSNVAYLRIKFFCLIQKLVFRGIFCCMR